MILLKNFLTSALPRKNLLKLRRADLFENLKLTNFHQVRSSVLCTKKCPNISYVGRRFCTKVREISTEGAAEDLSEDLDEVDDTEEMTTDKIFEEIAAGDEVILKNLKLLELEIAVLREEDSRVPDVMNMTQWKELLEIPTPTRRKKYLSFLRLNELKRMNEINKRVGKREYAKKLKEELGFHYYGLSGHTMFMRVYDKAINHLLMHRSFTSKFEVVLDCSYEEYMSKLNLKACARQILYCLTEARLHRVSNHLKLFNFDRDGCLGKLLPSYLCNIYEQYDSDIHKESYLQFYPKDKLIYLTPHAKASLKTFKPDKVYIIGAFVDKGTGVKASLAKAKENNLKMYKFPIDDYISWKNGTKSLPLNLALTVLLDMVFYNDWNRAFTNLPSRCRKQTY